MTSKIPRGAVRSFLMSAIFSCIFLVDQSSFNPSQAQNITRLEPGKTVERELDGGQPHEYSVVLRKKDFASIIFDQRGVDLTITAFGPDGGKLFVTGLTDRTEGLEPIRVIASTGGEYRLETRMEKPGAPVGRYTIRIEEIRQALPQDEVLVAAQTAYIEATELTERPQAESLRKIIRLAETASQLFRSVNDRRGEADSIRLLAFAHSSLGDKKKALEYYTQELALRRELKDAWGESDSLASRGAIYISLGDWQKALESFREGLPRLRAVNDRKGQGIVLNNLGALYKLLGDQRQSLNYFHEALPILQAVNDRKGQAIALNNLGQLHSALGEQGQAIEYYRQAAAISQEIKETLIEASALHNLGLIYEVQGEKLRALESFTRSLPIFRALGDRYSEAVSLAALGYHHHLMGDTTRAVKFLEEALPLSKSTANWRSEAMTRSYFARIERDHGNLVAARAHIDQALVIIESLRGKIGGGGLRASYLTTAQDYYELAIEIFMLSHRQSPSEGFDGMALETSERAIARSLLDSLAEANADIRNGVDSKLLARERELENQLGIKTQTLARLRGATQQQTDAIHHEIEKLIVERQETQTAIREASPRYAALTQPLPLSLREIQQRTLGENTMLLEYSLGRDRSYLWAVSPASIKSFELPKRETIEAAARRAYESLSAATTSEDSISDLSRMLLGPVAADLGKKRLLIVAGGALQYIPFAALYEPNKSNQRKSVRESMRAASRHGLGGRPLVLNHEIVSLPSASTLGILRREFDDRPTAPKQLAVFADPVFDENDLRVKSKKAESPAPSPATSSIEGNSLTVFDRLRSTRSEAMGIIALSRKSENLLALDFQANRARVNHGDLNQYRILHFATHGLLDAEHPELSGLVFSMVDEKGAPQNGYLRAHEVYNLKFNADLVVLSGCRTALGKEVRGEGLLGLTRGFMYAGAPRVLASLWRVPDKATAELMRRYYRGLLLQRLSPAAALRAAQSSILQDTRWAAPYYWAAFVLQGEWK
jgi:CHAT domain-containing protein/Tfp pilus assembly protein PilF